MSNDSLSVHPRYWKTKRAENDFKSALLDLRPCNTRYFDSDMAMIGALKDFALRMAGKSRADKIAPLTKQTIEIMEAAAKKHGLSYPEIIQILAEELALDAAYRVRAQRRGRRKICPLIS